MTDPGDVREILAELEAMPNELRDAARRIGPARWNTPPPEGGFCLVEQAWHLADLERDGYGERIRRLLAEDDPLLADFDGARVARERSYRTRSLEEGLAAFAAARRANLALLRSLEPRSWDRAGRQEGLGPVVLHDIPRMMREHDAVHRDEIAALLSETGASRESARA